MKFYVDILGFESNIKTIEIYPVSNDFDMGFIDVYSLESNYNDITFQCNFIENIFTYYPTTSNESFQLRTNMTHLTDEISLVGGRTLENDELLWIENERIKINSEISTNYYSIERGYNNSIATSHFYSIESSSIASIPSIFATSKRLTSENLICKFYKTNNIGGDIEVLGYGQISNVKLSNNRLLKVTCKQLNKLIEKTYIYNNSIADEFVNIYTFLSYDNTVELKVTNEFLRLLDIPNWFETDFLIESKKYNDNAISTKTVTLKDVFNQLLIYNNSFIKFNSLTGRYNIQKFSVSSSIDTAVSNIFLSSYLNINDYSVDVQQFQRVASIECKTKILFKDEDDKISTNDYEINLYDDVISSLSSKTIKYDLSSLVLKNEKQIPKLNKKVKDKIYFVNQIYDELTVNTTRWNRRFEIGKKYIFTDKHLFKTIVSKTHDTIWICTGYENNSCKFISMQNFNRSLISPFRQLSHVSGDIWTVNSLTTNQSALISPFSTFEVNDVLYVYTYKIADGTITTSTKTISNVSFSSNYRITLSGLDSTGDYIHYITYNHGYLTNKFKLFLYENYGKI